MSTSEAWATTDELDLRAPKGDRALRAKRPALVASRRGVRADVVALGTAPSIPLQRTLRRPARPTMSIVIPAHDEERTLARNLDALRSGASAALDVLVVCNGCTDQTATVARSAEPAVRVIEIAEPSKAEAVRVGNASTGIFPRIHLDADVEISGASLKALAAPLAAGQVLATAPRREIPRLGCSMLVRWYYDVWEQLPQVRSGLFGRGVVALSEEGQARVSALPQMMSDDLAMSDAFDESERMIVDEAVVIVRPPRTLSDLVRRRVRVATGNKQADEAGVRRKESATSLSVLLRMGLRQPWLLPRIPVFIGVAVVARRRSRRAVQAEDFSTWERDESSRQE